MRWAAIGLLVTAGVALAEPRTARLDATGVCELDAIAVRTNELAGRVAIVPDSAEVIRVTSRRDGNTLVARVALIEADGADAAARTLTAASCDELVESIAVVLSIVVREHQPDVERDVPVQPEVVVSPARPVELLAELELGGTADTTARGALVIGGRLARGRALLGLELGIDGNRHIEVGGQGTVQVSSGRITASPCVRAGPIAACGLLSGGWIRGRGEDLMDARTVTTARWSVGARVEWRQLVVSRLGVRVFGDLEQLLTTTRFLVDDAPVWTSSPREARLGVGVFLRVP